MTAKLCSFFKLSQCSNCILKRVCVFLNFESRISSRVVPCWTRHKDIYHGEFESMCVKNNTILNDSLFLCTNKTSVQQGSKIPSCYSIRAVFLQSHFSRSLLFSMLNLYRHHIVLKTGPGLIILSTRPTIMKIDLGNVNSNDWSRYEIKPNSAIEIKLRKIALFWMVNM